MIVTKLIEIMRRFSVKSSSITDFLKKEEFTHICEVLGRTPNFTELSIYSVMWSEHCSYKNSIYWLKKLPKDGPHMLVKASNA